MPPALAKPSNRLTERSVYASLMLMTIATPFLAAAADAELEDWGPLAEATDDEMRTTGCTLWTGEGDAVAVEAGDERVRAHPVRPDDRDAGRRGAARHRARRHRRVPARLDRHLADPRNHPQAVRHLLTRRLRRGHFLAGGLRSGCDRYTGPVDWRGKRVCRSGGARPDRIGHRLASRAPFNRDGARRRARGDR